MAVPGAGLLPTVHESLCVQGVTAPPNVHREQFSPGRLSLTVQAAARLGVAEIRDRILEEVESWSGSLDDDVTLVVARYHPES